MSSDFFGLFNASRMSRNRYLNETMFEQNVQTIRCYIEKTIAKMEKKKLKLEEVSIQSFVTTLDNDSKDTVKGAAMAFSTDCLTAGTFIVKCCAISLGQPEICLSLIHI